MRTISIVTALMMTGVLLAGSGAVRGEEVKVVMEGSTTVGPIAKAFAGYYMSTHPEVNVVVGEGGSGNGVKALLNGKCDVANMSRDMKKEEVKAAIEKDIFPCAHVIAMDGIVVVVHPSNPVKGLTVEQVRKIYIGEINNWKEVGGPDLKIVRISRENNSGTFECFETLVMKKEKMAADTEGVTAQGSMREAVRGTPAAIGYLGLGFVDRTVKAVVVDGIAPTRETIASGVYPIARPLFMYTNGYPKLGSHVFNLVTMHLTPKGQEIILDKGFIPLTNY